MLERSLAGRGRSWILAGFVASLLPALATPAEAHHHHHYRHIAHHSRHSEHYRFAAHHRHERHFAEHGAAPSRLAEIVVDANSGRVLYAQNEDDLRHPASITKVMTLYLLFKELDKGRLHLNSRLTISPHAAAQAPTKLGLRPGQTISVDDAIKAIVTKSANDMAVAIAEAIGGSEENFCAMMTREAHALGMMHTRYADASACPTTRRSRQPPISPSSAAPSRSAFRAISIIFRLKSSPITASGSATTITCSAASPASTASRPAIPAPPASIS